MFTLDTARLELGLGGSYRTATLADTPVGLYQMGEVRGTGSADASGNSHAGTYTGGYSLGAMGFLPEGGTAVTFNGTSGYVTMGDVAAFEFTGAFSVEVLARFTSTGALTPLATKCDAGFKGWGLFQTATTGKIQFLANTAAGATLWNFSTTAEYNDGLNHRIKAEWDGTTGANGVKIYVDGVLAAQATAAAGTPDTNAAAFMIASSGAGGFFAGTIAWVALYASVLSPTREAAHQAAVTWTDVSADVLGMPGMAWDYGIAGNSPLDRMASSGTLTFTLRNDPRNSGSMQGYYSPNHASCRSGFTHGIPVRVRLTSTTDRVKFWGRLYDIEPAPGRYRTQRTACTAHDFMYVLGDTDVRSITPQIGQTDDALIYTILEALPVTVQPMAVSVNSGLDTYPYAFNDISGGVKAPTALNKVVMSSWGKLFIKGDGTFCYRNRLSQGLLSSSLTLSDDMDGLTVPSTRNNIFDLVRVTHHPVTFGATATEVLYTLPAAVLFTAGESKTYFGDYTDPANRATYIAGKNFQDPPVSGTDWVAADNADGTGTSRTGVYTVTATFFTAAVKFVVTNGGAGSSYLVTLQARGRGVYDLGPVTQESGTGARPIAIDMRYQDNANTALAIGDFIRAEYGSIANQFDEVSVLPQKSSAFLVAALDREPGDLLTVTETVTGVSGAQALIHGVQCAIKGGKWFDCSWRTAPKLAGQSWSLDSATKSQLDSTTILAYG